MPNQNARDTFLENFSHYDIQEMHEVTFHTVRSFISMSEKREEKRRSTKKIARNDSFQIGGPSMIFNRNRDWNR